MDPEDSVDILELDRRAIDATGSIISGLTDDQLDLPTPCSEWTVRDVIEHLVTNATKHVASITGTRIEAPDGDPGERFQAVSTHLTATLSTPGALEVPVDLGEYGTFDGPVAIRVHFIDVLVHGWDIGQALGGITLDEELARPALRIAERYPDTEPTRGPGRAFAARQPVPDDAPTDLRLVATLGRLVRWPA